MLPLAVMAILARAVQASLLDGAQTGKGFRRFRALSRKYARMVLLVDGGARADWLSSRRRVGGQYGPHAFKARMVPRSAGFFFGSPASVLFRKYLGKPSTEQDTSCAITKGMTKAQWHPARPPGATVPDSRWMPAGSGYEWRRHAMPMLSNDQRPQAFHTQPRFALAGRAGRVGGGQLTVKLTPVQFTAVEQRLIAALIGTRVATMVQAGSQPDLEAARPLASAFAHSKAANDEEFQSGLHMTPLLPRGGLPANWAGFCLRANQA
ncbi:exported hypothetical protein [Cupriavidus necator]|uniref:Uncharacterized protein n=1 Tax=Cupriavidus necator TaxID=106590 RepID=A0A1K0IT44_CUPNE|nr:exported hypothetical protein [Cupriavidus necator]